jgi:hypothetical protein
LEQGRIDLFGCDALVLAASSRFGVDDPQRKEWLDDRVSDAKSLSNVQLLLAAVGIGLAVITGGAALGVWAGVFAQGSAVAALGATAGLAMIPVNVAFTADQTAAYGEHATLANTDVDPAESMIPADLGTEFAMLALAWATLGLDMSAVVKLLAPVEAGAQTMQQATKTIALRSGRSIEDVEALIPATLREHGVADKLIDGVDAARKGDGAGVAPAASATTAGAATRRADALAALTARYTEIEGRSVFVDFKVASSGRVTDISLRIGKDASAEMIAIHQRVVQQLERYTGLSGMLRSLVDRMFIPVPGMGTYEATVEVQKLSDAWASVAKGLAGRSYKDPDVAALIADLDHLESQIARHQARFEDWAARGTGTIAGELPAQGGTISTAVGAKDTIVDTNTAIALDKKARSVPLNAAETVSADAMAGKPIVTTPTTADELGAPSSGAIRTTRTTGGTDAEREAIMKRLETMKVGGGKGSNDRQIILEALLAESTGEAPRVFATADKGIVNKLATIAGINVQQFGKYKNLAEYLHYVKNTDTFSVTIEGHSMLVRPLLAIRKDL